MVQFVQWMLVFILGIFLAPSGAQGVTLSVCPSGTKCSKALNLHLSLIGLSQVSLRSVSGQSQFSLRSVSGQSQVSLRSVSGQSQVLKLS